MRGGQLRNRSAHKSALAPASLSLGPSFRKRRPRMRGTASASSRAYGAVRRKVCLVGPSASANRLLCQKVCALHSAASSPSTPRQPQAPQSAPVGAAYRDHRIEQLSSLKLSNYPRFSPPANLITQTQLAAKYGTLFAPGEWANDSAASASKTASVTLVGRITARRDASKKLIFADLSRDGVKTQLVFRRDEFEADKFAAIVKALKVGDVISATGYAGRTPAGELSVAARDVEMLAPCLWTLPKELTDPDTRFRARHLDLLVNESPLTILKQRAAIIAHVRAYLTSRGFLEVETPILSPKQGGATARPFTTTSNALSEGSQTLFLRVAPELYLKQLVIGGADRVFEIGKQFRNEEIDSTHNPEFTTCEFYMAYADLEEVMCMTEELLRGAAIAAGGGLQVSHTVNDDAGLQREVEIDFAAPFARIDVVSELERHMGRKLPDFDSPTAVSELVSACNELKVPLPSPATIPRILDRLISHLIEPTLSPHPTFLTNHPAPLSPLAKTSSSHSLSTRTARFELFIANRELVNAYEELNDPREQRARFALQAQQRTIHGDDEAMPSDDGFCDALEWGLPPTTGWGLGIDRLVMLLADRFATGPRRLLETFPSLVVDLLAAMPVVSEKHAYEDADVRIVIGDTLFLVHTLCLTLNSDYFKACFRGPWTENESVADAETGQKLRQITLEEVDAEEFSLLLDWIYRTKTFLDPTEAFALARIADHFQVMPLLKYLNDLSPPSLNWKNIQHWLEIAATGQQRFEQCINSAVDFLQESKPSVWIRVWYLAEKYDLPALRNAENFKNCSIVPDKDPYFQMLSPSLQRDLLFNCLQRCMAHVAACGKTHQRPAPVELIFPCTANSLADTT
ncbi:hypothetical protein HDU86_006794 [Geranomyces michiganensis]|nr:hypothetical protein HDU86_006794 [Geranomyces michiganensis]